MGVFIGLDVSLSKTAVCVVDRDGAVLWQGKVPSEPGPLIARLAEWSGTVDLAGIEAELIGKLGWERSLTRVLKHVSYDIILLDCPPTLGILTTNALVAAQTVLVPVQCEYLAFRALAQLLKIVEN